VTYTYVLSTDVGKMRLVIPDRVEVDAVFSDEELEAFVELEGSWRLGAALALETIASSTLLIMKMIRVKNVEVMSSDKAASVLLKRAADLRAQASNDDPDDAFDIVPIIYDDFTLREHLRAVSIREG
jgi:hypothetical protein